MANDLSKLTKAQLIEKVRGLQMELKEAKPNYLIGKIAENIMGIDASFTLMELKEAIKAEIIRAGAVSLNAEYVAKTLTLWVWELNEINFGAAFDGIEQAVEIDCSDFEEDSLKRAIEYSFILSGVEASV